MASERYRNQKTYFPPSSTGAMSAGLLRARKPFFTRNLLTGCLVASFAIGVYFYSISAVKQDDFSNEDIQALIQETRKTQSVVDTETRLLGAGQAQTIGYTPVSRSISNLSFEATWSDRIGFRGRSAPSVIVKNAPDVDRLGRISERTV